MNPHDDFLNTPGLDDDAVHSIEPDVPIRTSSVLSLVTRVVGIGTSFLLGVLVARAFGTEGKGALSVIMQVPGILVLLLDLGVSMSLVYFVSSRKVKSGTAAANSLAMAGVLGLAGAPIIYLLLSGPLALIPNVSPWATAFAIAALPLTLLAGWLSGISVGLGDLRMPARFALVSSGVTLAGVGAALAAGRGSVTAVVAASVAGTAVALVVMFLGLRRHLHPLRTDLAAARSMTRFSFKAYVTDIAGHMHERQDVLILGWLAGTAAVGLYSVGVSFAELSWYIPGALSSAILAKGARTTEYSAVDYTTRTVRISIVFMLGTIALSAAFVPFLLPFVYGKPFAPAIFPFFALLPGVLSDGITRVLWSYQITRGRMYWKLAIGTTVVNLTAVMLLVPKFGAVGAALASSISYTVLAVLAIRHFCIDTGAAPSQVLVPTGSDISIIMRTLSGMLTRSRSKPSSNEGDER